MKEKKKKKWSFDTCLLISSPRQASILFKRRRKKERKGLPMMEFEVIIKKMKEGKREKMTTTMVDCSIIRQFLIDSFQ